MSIFLMVLLLETGNAGFPGRDCEFDFGHVEFEIPMRYPSGELFKSHLIYRRKESELIV